MYTFLIVIQFIAIGVLFCEMTYITVQRPSRMQITLMILVVSTLIMLIGYHIEVSAKSLEAALFGCCVSYLGKPFAIMTSLIFILECCGYELKPKTYIIWSIISAITPALVFTCNHHNLYYTNIHFDDTNKYSPLEVGHGIFYYIYMAYSLVIFITSLTLIIMQMVKNKSKNARIQNAYLLGTIACTAIGYGAYLLGITNGYDTTMTGAVVSAFLISILFVKYRLFDTVSLAKEQALYGSSSGLIVFDPFGKTAYTNELTDTLLKKDFTVNELATLPDGESTLHKEDRVYEVKKKMVVDKGHYFGSTVELTDITAKYNYSTQLEKDVESRTKEIRHIQRSITTSFAGIVEARDRSTGEHINRLKKYVEVLAKQLRADGQYTDVIDDEFIDSIIEVAPLHDIGKLSIPDSILQKPGKLTPEEFEVIKTHTTCGAQIISECLDGVERPEYVELAKQVALFHHEKFNGTGYPMKLAGNDIPLPARIIAVADVYDAIRSERCYKPPMDLEAARQVILDGNGTHFDPVIVDAFVHALSEIEAL